MNWKNIHRNAIILFTADAQFVNLSVLLAIVQLLEFFFFTSMHMWDFLTFDF